MKEDKQWILINKDELPKQNGKNNQIKYSLCVGYTLYFKMTTNKRIIKIKILDYIKDKRSKFKIQYIFMKNTEYEECIIKEMFCYNLINRCQIRGIIPSLNQWIKKDNYWIGIDTDGREFKFSTDNKETEYNILHSTWCVADSDYVMTGSLNNTGIKMKLHRAVYFNCNKQELDKNIHMCIDHMNNNRADNRIDNLSLVSQSKNGKNKNTNNKYGLTGLHLNRKGYYSLLTYKKYQLYTKTRYDLEEAKIDNLIAQRYLGYKHNEDQFYKLEGLSEERIKEVTNLLDKKIESSKYKVKKQKEYAYDFIEKDNLIGIKTFKRNGTSNEICWVDRDFGRIEGDKFIVKGCVCNRGEGYFNINNNRVNVYVMIGEMSLQNYRNNNFHINHINQKPNENYRDNLEIVTIQSNMMSKNGKGYITHKRKNGTKYQVKYAYNWKYFDLYIKGLKEPTFNTEEEATIEVKRRKEIINKYRFRVKTLEELNEVIDFTEEHELDLDSAYIVWKGLDTLENIKNYLKILTNE